MDDLRRLLSPHAKPVANLGPAPEIELFQGVRYLMPLRPSLEKLGLSQSIPSKNKVVCPGFPNDSFFYYAFDRSFEGDFNRIYVVTDQADQVVSVQLVCETPRSTRLGGKSDWYCYNFVNSRTKALASLLIHHEVKVARKGGTLQIDTTLIEVKTGKGGKVASKKALESVRWFVPKPLAELILYCSK